MAKQEEVHRLANILASYGIPYKMAKKNLLECDRYFIDKLSKLLENNGVFDSEEV